MALKPPKLAYNIAMNIQYQRGIFNKSIIYILLAAIAAGLGLWAAQHWFKPAPPLQTVRLFPQTRPLASFSLQAADGSAFTNQNLKGRWHVVFLGFTRCPDICPTTLADLSKSQKIWESLPEKKRPRLLLVSVDPERDTPKGLAEYARFFHKDTLTATAQEPALRDFAQAVGFVYAKVPMGEDYTMDHSATLAVIDPQGHEVGIIRPPFSPEKIAKDLIQLSEATP
jgi:protein SCO1